MRGVVITGPNTGGKTVALKTVGLLSVMAQCGLHVPVEEGSVFCLHNLILCDIGDGQSIAENLSTFSAHLTAIIGILEKATDESLVLLDELGSGTDPAEGMGIAVAVLEELRRRGCLFVVTTHYPEIKEYAKEARGVENARMAFDRESLRPLFRLTMGEAGESCALYIAQRLHFPAHLLAIARQAAYGSGKEREREKAGCLPAAFSPAGEQSPAAACAASPRVQREKRAVCDTARARLDAFQVGDCVTVEPGGEIGIVYETADERGNVGVQIKKEKRRILYKRLTRKVAASELYPPDYDFSVVFDTVANRKARRVMERRHDPDAVIELEKGRTEDE